MTKRRKAAAMRIRTPNLRNSFSSDNKRQKLVLPETARHASVLGENRPVGINCQLAMSVKLRTVHTFNRNVGQTAHLWPGTCKKATKVLQCGGKLRGYKAARRSDDSSGRLLALNCSLGTEQSAALESRPNTRATVIRALLDSNCVSHRSRL